VFLFFPRHARVEATEGKRTGARSRALLFAFP
jgi:hypothetical protein